MIDWGSIIGGLIVGGGGIGIILGKRIKYLNNLIEAVIAEKRDIEKLIEDYKKDKADGKISQKEMEEILSDVEVIVRELDIILRDIEEIEKGGE